MKTCWILLVGALALVLCGCPNPVTCDSEVEDCDGGNPAPKDICNSKDEALTLAECEVKLGLDGGKFGYIAIGADGGIDQDWYRVQLGTLTPQSLMHITAGYGVLSTPVNLALSVLKEDGTTGLARKIDHHSANAPKPIDIIFPFSDSNTKLLVQLTDEAASNRPNTDALNPYLVRAEVIDNPDKNEPNDTIPKEILLTAGPVGQVGVGNGALATDDDIDKFTVTVPGGRKILYLHILGYCASPTDTVCNTRLMPEPPFRLGYTLFDPSGKPVSEGQAANNFVPVDLATARLTTAGQYTLVISGYKPPNVTAVTPGDLRTLYRVDVQLLDDLDTNEPNDSITTPKVVPLTYGGGTSLTGRLGYVPDPDVFAVDLAGTGNAGVLRYKLLVTQAAGRFAPLAPVADRQLRVITEVTTGATSGDRQINCKNSQAICPKGYEGSIQAQSLVEGLCTTQEPPWCTWAERNEEPAKFATLKNMEGAIPIAAHGGVSRYFIFVQDEGNNYADDRDYTLIVSYDADPDDTARAGLPFQTQTTALSLSNSFPVPSTAGEVSGVLTHGYGRIINNRIDQGQGVRGPDDYDAVPGDVDRFEFNLPSVSFPLDRTWALEWEIGHNDAGSPPGELALEVSFCTGATFSDGGCLGPTSLLAYSGNTLSPWYADANNNFARGLLWKRQVNANNTVVTAQPLGCFCFEPQFMASSHYFIKVGAVDRQNNQPINYRLRQSVAPYPQTYGLDGGSYNCPFVPDAGVDAGAFCKFSKGQ